MGFWLGEEQFLCVSIVCLSVFSPKGYSYGAQCSSSPRVYAFYQHRLMKSFDVAVTYFLHLFYKSL